MRRLFRVLKNRLVQLFAINNSLLFYYFGFIVIKYQLCRADCEMDVSLEETKDKLIKKKRNHLLKRLKKHFGIVRRDSSSCSSQNNLPPLQFHNIHGDNIRISRDGTLARRFESFCRALTFSARPVRINERIYIRFSEVSNNWNGGIRFGFTNNDPATLENALPKYACPDLTNRPGFWAKALHEQYCELNNILYYYVNSTGDVIYGINGEEKGIILSGINVRGLLWTIIDIYGNCTAVELVDARLFSHQQSPSVSASSYQRLPPKDSVNCIVSPMQTLSIVENETNLPPLKYHTNYYLTPLPFHRTKGRNIIFSPDRLVATRTEADFCQGYVFSSLPIQPDENIIIQILKTDHTYVGSLAIGLTSCNPSALNEFDLPYDSNFLLDRPEYWVVNKDVAMPCEKGDEISFSMSSTGEVTIKKNCGSPLVMHVDHRLRLWPFLDVYGSTQSIRIFREPLTNSTKPVVRSQFSTPYPMQRIKSNIHIEGSSNSLNAHTSCSSINSPISSSSTALVNVNEVMPTVQSRGSIDSSLHSASVPQVGQIIVPTTTDMIQIQPGGTILVVNLPQSSVLSPDLESKPKPLKKIGQMSTAYSDNNMPSSCNSKFVENPKNKILNVKCGKKSSDVEVSGSECTICYEKNIDSVLYMCGHMCMCYECAIEQWRGAGGGQCPLCRAVIRDVIRTYTT